MDFGHTYDGLLENLTSVYTKYEERIFLCIWGEGSIAFGMTESLYSMPCTIHTEVSSAYIRLLFVYSERIVGCTVIFLLEQEAAEINVHFIIHHLIRYQSDGLLLLKYTGLTTLSLGWVIPTRL